MNNHTWCFLSPARPPGYELFFAPLVVVLSPAEIERIQFAYFVSKYGHAKQFRDDGSRYFDHPKAAAWIYIKELNGRNQRIITDLLLHDLSEDTYLLSSYRISMNFGVDVALDVRAVTKLRRGEGTEEYLRRVVARGPSAIVAKLCDNLSNMRTLSGCTEEKQKRKKGETKNYHIPILIPPLRACGGEWKKVANFLENKIKRAIGV